MSSSAGSAAASASRPPLVGSAASTSSASVPSQQSRRKRVPAIALLTRLLLDPWTELFSPSRKYASHRFAAVPPRDAMLSAQGFAFLPMLSPTYPNFLGEATVPIWKVRSIIDLPSMGTRTYTGDLVIHNDIADHEQLFIVGRQQGNKRARIQTDDPSAAAAADPSSSSSAAAAAADSVTVQWDASMDREPIAAHTVYPLSVSLRLDDNDFVKLRERLGADASSSPYVDTVWPKAIRGYRPFRFDHSNVMDHWKQRVLGGEELDPNFPCGIFGAYRNSMSIVIRALSKPSATTKESEKLPMSILTHYVAIIALQFWTLANRRWLELDPNRFPPPTTHMPQFIFYFHHQTDCYPCSVNSDASIAKPAEAKNRKEKAMAAAKRNFAEDPLAAARGVDHEGGFIPFYHALLSYVFTTMLRFSSDTAFGRSCIALFKGIDQANKFVDDEALSLTRNHTLFFTISRFKLHPLVNHVDAMRKDSEALLYEKLTKFYPCNKAEIRYHEVKPSKPLQLARRYINPTFWSHLTVTPDSPVVQTECTFFCPSPEEPIHQIAVLRRLVFCLNQQCYNFIVNAALSCQLAPHPIDVVIRSASKMHVHQLAPNQIAPLFFRAKEACTEEKRKELLLSSKVLLPPVVAPALLRYCFSIEGTQGHSFIPALSRNMAATPTSDELDIESFTRHSWLRLSSQGDQKPVINGVDQLLSMAVVVKGDPVFLSIYPSTPLVERFPTFREIGGLHEHGWCKVNPRVDASDLTFNSTIYRFSWFERYLLINICLRPIDRRLAPLDDTLRTALWTLLEKICQSESQLVRSFLHLIDDLWQPPLKEEGEAPVKVENEDLDEILAPAPSKLSPIDHLYALQNSSRIVKQGVLFDFAYGWSPSEAKQPSTTSGRKRRTTGVKVEGGSAAASMPRLASMASPYLAARTQLLNSIAKVYDHCNRPAPSREVLAEFACSIIAIDWPALHVFVHSVNDLQAPLSPADEKDSTKIMEIVQKGIREIYLGLTPELDKGFGEFSFTSFVNCGLGLVFPAHNSMTPRPVVSIALDNARASFQLKTVFEATFQAQSVVLVENSIQIFIAFAFLYIYNVHIEPLIRVISILYPTSNEIRMQRDGGDPLWIGALLPSDSTPQLTQVLHNFIAKLTDSELFAEIESAAKQKVKVSDRSEATLLALQHIVRVQSDIHLEREHSNRIGKVSGFISQLLERKNEHLFHINGPVASSYTHQTRGWIQAEAVKKFKFEMDSMHEIRRSSVLALFDQLTSVCAPGENLVDPIVWVICEVARQLEQSAASHAPSLFVALIDRWFQQGTIMNTLNAQSSSQTQHKLIIEMCGAQGLQLLHKIARRVKETEQYKQFAPARAATVRFTPIDR